MLESKENIKSAVIKVIGIGGGGSNAVEHMMQEHIEGVDFFAVNTDAQALLKNSVNKKIQIGSGITKGLGAGANPEIGKSSAEEDRDKLRSVLEGSDMIFIAAGMGGGTGTGAAPIIAELAKDLGILTVAVVTKPFNFEGKKRINFAEKGIISLSKCVDSLIIIPNDKLLKVLSKNVSLLDAFSAANNILKGAVQGIAELITCPGLMNVDFADVRTVMSEMGYAIMGSGVAYGEDRAEVASNMAISSPLLEDTDLSGARGVLINITASFDLRLEEFEIVGNKIRSFASDDATVVIGTSLNPEINDGLRVTMVATGINVEKKSNIKILQNAKNLSKKINDVKDFNQKKINILKNKKYSTIKINKKNNIFNEDDMDYLDIPAFLRNRQD